MSTSTSRFRPLTPQDMKEYEEELKATQAAAEEAAQNPEIEDPATPEGAEPQTPESQANTDTDKTDWKKRYGDLTAHNQRQLKIREDKIRELEEQLASKSQARYASDEAVAEFESTVETTPVLKELIRREAERLIGETKKEFKQQSESEKALARKQVEDVAKLSKAHPDWREYDTGAPMHPIFSDWLDKQPIKIREMADYTTTGDMDSAIAVLTMFKAQVQVKTDLNTKKKPSASNPSPNSRPDIPAPKGAKLDIVKWDKEMSDALRLRNRSLQEKLMADLNKARAEGRI